ncbi:MAG TPA: YhcH/YjgK/YiaL family protein [Candidatus Andersenbacteria bacterium]|nr:YhcH/YjgK/YiaL family protein [Candidatus Andersenbacteria bacterium]
MLYGQYNHTYSYTNLLSHPIWKDALIWIQQNAKSLPDGEHAIRGRDLYANIQSLQTIPASEAAFEVHEEYIDIHYCLSGAESIGYAPVGTLVEKELNKEKDYQLFEPTKNFSTCIMQPDSFAIFFPQELHMPKLQNSMDTHVKKVVIKIKKDLIL